MAAHLRVVAETPTAPAPKKRRRATAKKPAPETARDRKNRLARERRAAKKVADQKAAEATPEAQPSAPVKLSLAEAIELDDYEQILIAQRREAVADLKQVSGPAKPALHRQIALLSKEIAGLVAAKTEGTDIGDATETPDEDFDPDA